MSTMTAAGVQRIYIGGIDPQRLSIDDVSSRLRRLVDVVSIETPTNKPSEDCFVKSGPSFFYLNARCPSDEDDAAPSAADAAKTSPLQVLSKAYNNVKWKGCTLRVEEARPHFLDRLRLEREERERKEWQEKEEGLQLKGAEGDDENGAANDKAATSVAGPPRNLRIRRRHGEEAFRVDTKPIDVGSTVDDTNAYANGGNKWKSRAESNYRHAKRSASDAQWDNFGTALDKLRRKRAKHADQYAEQKRRLKRQAKGRGPKGGVDAVDEDIGSLNRKVFLNRAVHVRFAEATSTENDVFATTATPSKRKDENSANNSRYEESTEDSSVGDESSAAPSDSDSSDDVDNMRDDKAKEDYTWSDDDDETGAGEANEGLKGQKHDDEEDVSSDSGDSVDSNDGSRTKAAVQMKEYTKSKPTLASSGYAWSDDDISDDDSSDDEAPQQPHGGPRDMGRSFSSLKPVDYDKPDGCKECSKPTDYDEFSSAVDFTVGDIANEGQEGEDEPLIDDGARGDYQLDGDVSCNLNVLGQLFPEMASIKPNKPSAPDEEGEGDSQAEGSTPQVSRPGWGVTGLMQRYDPNDSKSAKFEVEVSSKTAQKEIKTTGKEKDTDENSDLGSDSDDEDENGKAEESSANVSTSSEDSDDNDEDDDDDENESAGESDKNEISAVDVMEVVKDKHTEEDADDEKEIYEQDKLEGIFQEARSGEGSGGFQMSQLFGDLGNAPEIPPESNNTKTASASGFSFGFDVGAGIDNDNDCPSETVNGDKSASGFSFSFNVPPGPVAEASDTNIASASTHDQVDVATGSPLLPGNKEPEVMLKRRRGLLFPENVLDDLEQSFFHMNEGKRILENYEAMKIDPESQNAWQEERKTLTLDWKRKQKFALSRKQKRRK